MNYLALDYAIKPPSEVKYFMSGQEYPNFGTVFHRLTHHSPMAWQCRLACGSSAEPDNPETLRHGVLCESHLLDIPTGCGKTAGMVIAWLWNRIILGKFEWPRRLVYCLPMRSLVEQTRKEVGKWLRALHEDYSDLDSVQWLVRHSPIVLMGGEDLEEDLRDWDVFPEQPAIIIGTQDMLISRVLNRGYGMSRYRWPIHFGLLSNDCLWILDELQLMGTGLATASQLEALRRARPDGLGSYPGCSSATWYASATARSDAVNTREWREKPRQPGFHLSLFESERTASRSTLGVRRFAVKKLELHPEWHFGSDLPPAHTIVEILKRHRLLVTRLAVRQAPPNIPRRSIVMCNRVDRAVKIFKALKAAANGCGMDEIDIVLLHSRFRPFERGEQTERLAASEVQGHAGGQILVSTQVIEAGQDISSAILWTEVAPLSSLVQRFGRLNRIGEFGSDKALEYEWEPTAVIVGLDLPEIPPRPKEEKEAAEKEVSRRYLPYDRGKCESAWECLERLGAGASPAALEQIRTETEDSVESVPSSLQRHELLDFFDTDSNLSLGYTDVTTFVRGSDSDTDIYVIWREWEGSDDGQQPSFFFDVQSPEICSVPIGKIKQAWEVCRHGWLWLGKAVGWVEGSSRDIFPGATLLLPVAAGGYSNELGWTGDPADKPFSLYQPPEFPADEDLLSCLSHGWQSIAAHCKDVKTMLDSIIERLGTHSFLTSEERAACLEAALWHDVGKGHASWQDALAIALKQAAIDPPQIGPFAKFSLSESPMLKDPHGNQLTGSALRREVYRLKQLFRPGMAHEAASSLALRQHHINTGGWMRSVEAPGYLAQLLSEYLVMSHHGRVRKVLRDELPKTPKVAKDLQVVRGLCEGDPLPSVTVDGQQMGGVPLSVDCCHMGRDGQGHESYTRGFLRLLEHYGPFRLAFLEVLLRAADARASKGASKQDISGLAIVS